jgi:hypothetical protein
MPEWPLDQSYDTAYAKMLPLRLKAVVEMGPGWASKAMNVLGKAYMLKFMSHTL